MQRLTKQQIQEVKFRHGCITFKEEAIQKNPEFVTDLTGLANISIIRLILSVTVPFLDNELRVLSPFQELMLTLVKLRHDMEFTYLEFQLDCRYVRQIFCKWIDLIYCRFKGATLWRSREEIKSTMPLLFRKEFGNKLAIILDFLEFKIDISTIPEVASYTWNNYNRNNTLKFLIGITPQGYVGFISNAYGGSISNTQIIEHCGILNNLLVGDYVIANRYIHVDNLDNTDDLHMCKLIQPSLLHEKPQLHPVDWYETQKIANVRKHVETIINSTRQQWQILSSTMTYVESEVMSSIEKIVTVCYALTNTSVQKFV